MGKSQEEKKVERYNVLRKGKVIFWNVSESELFDIMEDLAVECYYNKTLTSQDIWDYSNDMTKWELVSEVHNIYNRLILFRANQWHTAQTYFGNNQETGRLSQLFFFDTEY